MTTIPPTGLAASVVKSVKARGDEVTDQDGALVDLALRYAHQIDAGVQTGGQDATKALYLGPHLLKALGALGCTPESRGVCNIPEADGPARGPAAVEDELGAMRRKRGGA